MTPRSMAAIRVTSTIMLNTAPNKKEAVGKNTKCNEKFSEPPPTPRKGHLSGIPSSLPVISLLEQNFQY